MTDDEPTDEKTVLLRGDELCFTLPENESAEYGVPDGYYFHDDLDGGRLIRKVE
jgi:hypothetical protein